jgi:hypothetical protein
MLAGPVGGRELQHVVDALPDHDLGRRPGRLTAPRRRSASSPAGPSSPGRSSPGPRTTPRAGPSDRAPIQRDQIGLDRGPEQGRQRRRRVGDRPSRLRVRSRAAKAGATQGSSGRPARRAGRAGRHPGGTAGTGETSTRPQTEGLPLSSRRLRGRFAPPRCARSARRKERPVTRAKASSGPGAGVGRQRSRRSVGPPRRSCRARSGRRRACRIRTVAIALIGQSLGQQAIGRGCRGTPGDCRHSRSVGPEPGRMTASGAGGALRASSNVPCIGARVRTATDHRLWTVGSASRAAARPSRR